MILSPTLTRRLLAFAPFFLLFTAAAALLHRVRDSINVKRVNTVAEREAGERSLAREEKLNEPAESETCFSFYCLIRRRSRVLDK